MDHHDQSRGTKRARFSLSQETITMVTVGVALAGLILMELGETRAEARADRARIEATMIRIHAEGQAARAEMHAEGLVARAEMRAEGLAAREAFERQIIQLVKQQGTLHGLVDGLRNPIPSPEN